MASSQFSEVPPGIVVEDEAKRALELKQEIKSAARALLAKLKEAGLDELQLRFGLDDLTVVRRDVVLPPLSDYDESTILFLQGAVRKWLARKRLIDSLRETRNSRQGKAMRQRKNLAVEMLSSEESYLNALQRCVENFLIPARQSGLIDSSKLRTIFQNIEVIADLSRRFVEDLRERIAAWPSVTTYGDVVDRHIKGFVAHYETYLVGYTTAQETLKEVLVENTAFAEWLKSALKARNMTSLADMTITPVQRLPRYEMLLSSLLKNTAEDHSDYNALCVAHDTILETNTTINLNTRRRTVALEVCEALTRSDHNFTDRHVLEKNRLLSNGLLCHQSRVWVLDLPRTAEKLEGSSSSLAPSTSSEHAASVPAGLHSLASSSSSSSSSSAPSVSSPRVSTPRASSPQMGSSSSSSTKPEYSSSHHAYLFNNMLVLCSCDGKKIQRIYSWTTLESHHIHVYHLFGHLMFRLTIEEADIVHQLFFSVLKNSPRPYDQDREVFDAWSSAFSSILKTQLYLKSPQLEVVDHVDCVAPLTGELEVHISAIDSFTNSSAPDVSVQVVWTDQNQSATKLATVIKIARHNPLDSTVTFNLRGSLPSSSQLKFELYALDPSSGKVLLGTVERAFLSLETRGEVTCKVPLTNGQVLTSMLHFRARFVPAAAAVTSSASDDPLQHFHLALPEQIMARGRTRSGSVGSKVDTAAPASPTAGEKGKSGRSPVRQKASGIKAGLKNFKDALGRSTPKGLGFSSPLAGQTTESATTTIVSTSVSPTLSMTAPLPDGSATARTSVEESSPQRRVRHSRTRSECTE